MKFYTRPRRMPSVIIVSLIDILAILLIFVIVTTTFRRDQPQIIIKLPESTSATEAPNTTDPAILSIGADERIFLDTKPVTLEELRAALLEMQQITPNRPLAMSADRQAPFGLIIKVIDILKDAGVKNIPAFTEKPGS
jgi:biopolymer transport protein ExbD